MLAPKRLLDFIVLLDNPILKFDNNNKLQLINPVSTKLLGSHSIGTPITDILAKHKIPSLINQGNGETMKCPCINGIIHTITLFHAEDGYYLVFAVATPSLDDQVRRNRLESLGLHSSSISNAINNSVSTILENLSVLKDAQLKEISIPEALETSLDRIYQSALHTKTIATQFLNYAKGIYPATSYSLQALVQESCDMAAQQIAVDFSYTFPTTPIIFNDDTASISQLLHNLILNSIQASKDNKPIRLAIDIHKTHVDAHYKLKLGKYIVIKLIDQGIGISEQQHEAIIKLRNATTPPEKGLGLFVVFQLLNKLKGDITFNVHTPHGTEVTILLPDPSELNSNALDLPTDLESHFEQELAELH